MDRLLSVEAFVRVAETGNFAKAAQQLGVTRDSFGDVPCWDKPLLERGWVRCSSVDARFSPRHTHTF